MRGLSVSNAIALLGIVATIIMGWVALQGAYDLSERGSAPPKRLEAKNYTVSDPLKDLAQSGSNLKVSVRQGEKELSNVRVVQTFLRNTGQSPVVPGDIVEPISIETEKPWEIVNVVNSTDAISVQLKWKRVSSTRFEAERTLLNPSDAVFVTVYLTNAIGPWLEPSITWKARIVNLKAIDTPTDPDFFGQLESTLPVVVFLWGWGVPFTLISFLVYLTLTVLLMTRARIIDSARPISYLWLIGGILINLFAAEAGATLLFGTTFVQTGFVIDVLNTISIVSNAALFIYLYSRKAKNR